MTDQNRTDWNRTDRNQTDRNWTDWTEQERYPRSRGFPSRIKDQGSDQGPWTLDQGPRITDLVLARMAILEEIRT